MRLGSMLTLLILAGLTGGLAGCGDSDPAPGCGKLTVHQAWLTPAHPGSREMAGYFTLHNEGSQPVKVNGVSSDAFGRVIFQDKAAASGQDDGAQRLAPFTIAAGQSLDFKPGHREAMLYSPSRAYHAGDRVRLELSCGRKHDRLQASATVRDRHGRLPSAGDHESRSSRQQVLKDGRNGGGADAADDSRTAD